MRRTRARTIGVISTLSVLVCAPLAIAGTTGSSASPVGLPAAADSFVSQARPADNFGTDTALKTSGSPARVAYLRFTVGALSAPVTKATLHLYAVDSSTTGYQVAAVADDTWTETGITYANAPARGAVVASSGQHAAGVWTSVDVTSLITGSGTFSVAVTNASATTVRYASRESTHAPSLTVATTSPSPSPTASPTASPTPSPSASPSPTPSPSPTTSPSPTPSPSPSPSPSPTSSAPPPQGGYFSLRPVGSWSSLPSDATCQGLVHYSTWEPRRDNTKANNTMPNATAVHAAFAARPVSTGGSDDPRWDSWLLQRVDGQFTGTTDEIFQWAACKWGLSDDVLRAIAVRESTWYQYETYPSGRPVNNWGSGDMITSATPDTVTFCTTVAQYGYDYQNDFGSGICPKTYSIAGVMSWEAPSWGAMPGNQNGTFPFNRQSTAFALDYLGAQLRGCYEGWEWWLAGSGVPAYAAGDMWGCVGAWYSGDWHSTAADGYISRVQNELANFTWLQPDWPTIKPSCSPTYGCPGPPPY